jgi:hypothetical protein
VNFVRVLKELLSLAPFYLRGDLIEFVGGEWSGRQSRFIFGLFLTTSRNQPKTKNRHKQQII